MCLYALLHKSNHWMLAGSAWVCHLYVAGQLLRLLCNSSTHDCLQTLCLRAAVLPCRSSSPFPVPSSSSSKARDCLQALCLRAAALPWRSSSSCPVPLSSSSKPHDCLQALCRGLRLYFAKQGLQVYPRWEPPKLCCTIQASWPHCHTQRSNSNSNACLQALCLRATASLCKTGATISS